MVAMVVVVTAGRAVTEAVSVKSTEADPDIDLVLDDDGDRNLDVDGNVDV